MWSFTKLKLISFWERWVLFSGCPIKILIFKIFIFLISAAGQILTLPIFSCPRGLARFLPSSPGRPRLLLAWLLSRATHWPSLEDTTGTANQLRVSTSVRHLKTAYNKLHCFSIEIDVNTWINSFFPKMYATAADTDWQRSTFAIPFGAVKCTFPHCEDKKGLSYLISNFIGQAAGYNLDKSPFSHKADT